MNHMPSQPIPMVRDEDFLAGVLTRRCFAFLIDAVVIGVLCTLLWFLLVLFGLITLGLGLGAMAALPAVPFLYHFLCLLRPSGATAGQALMGLTVRRDNDLGPPDVLQAFLFTAAFYLTVATTGVLFLVALFTVRHRTLHDLLSGLVVVRRDAFRAWSLDLPSHPG